MLSKGEKKRVGERQRRKKDDTIDLNIPHITKTQESRDTRFMYVVEIFVV